MAILLEHEIIPQVSGPFTPAADLKSRLRREREILDCIKKNGEKWPKGLGYYNDVDHTLVNQLEVSGDRSRGAHPPTFHGQLKGFIDRLRKVKPSDQPLVILDVGGGAGSTWCINATQFEDDIKRSRVAFVVSNLEWSPEQFIAESRKQNESCPDMVNRGQRLVQFVNSSFRELRDKYIRLPNGKNVPLSSAVDLIHESRSLTSWSHVPELDILYLRELLSQHGSYFIAPLNSPLSYDNRDLSERHQREEAVRNTHNLLQQSYGLKRVDQIEKGHYSGVKLLYKVFRQSAAPKVEI